MQFLVKDYETFTKIEANRYVPRDALGDMVASFTMKVAAHFQ